MVVMVGVYLPEEKPQSYPVGQRDQPPVRQLTSFAGVDSNGVGTGRLSWERTDISLYAFSLVTA